MASSPLALRQIRCPRLPAYLAGHIGTAISHARPSSRTPPFTPPRILVSSTLVPKPLRVGGLTGGPPASVQRSTSCPSSTFDHSTRTCPVVTDRAPYLAALVANSCRATAIAWAT